MAAYNFGMLTAGLPDMAQRQTSQQVLGDDFYQGQQNDWLKNWQSQFESAAPRYVETNPGTFTTNGDVNALMNAPGARNGFMGDDAAWQQYATDRMVGAYNNNLADTTYLDIFGVAAPTSGMHSGQEGYLDNSARTSLEAQKTQQQTQYDAMMQARQQNQQAQQSAYNQSNGGGFNGGIINSSYSTPFGMTGGIGAPAQVDGITMPDTQSWGMAGYGGPTGGASQGGFGSGWGQNAPGSQPQGWGGPFTNKNPWAAS